MMFETSHRKLAFIVLMMVLPVAYQAGATMPSRSECIATHDMDWTGVEEDHGDVLNRIPKLDGIVVFPSLAAIKISADGKAIYFQFSENCDQRWQMSEQIFTRWQELDRGLPKFMPNYIPIVPTPATIDVKGRFWRD